MAAPNHHASFDTVLAALTAGGEATRLRLLALLGEAELTVSELVTILGQSQPRISRHLKLLVEAGLVERHREGAWAFFRAAQGGPGAGLAHDIIGRLAPADPVLAADHARLAEVRRIRADQAARYFAQQARNWDELRALHVAEDEVEAAIIAMVGGAPLRAVLDCGTGTGRVLELLAPQADRAVGIDQSPQMLSLARTRLERAGLRHVVLRQADLYALPVERGAYDLVIFHQVLHYLDDPARAIREAVRALSPGGRLIVVDFAPHEEEALRQSHAHRRLGFSRDEIDGALAEAGLAVMPGRDLVSGRAGGKLTVSIWLGRDARVIADPVPLTAKEFA